MLVYPGAHKARETRQAEKRAFEDIKDSAREETRKETYLALEKRIAEEQEARKLRDKKQSPEYANQVWAVK